VTTPDDARAQSANARPVDVRIRCSVRDKAAFGTALKAFMDGQGLPGGYAVSVRDVDAPIIPVVRLDPEAQP